MKSRTKLKTFTFTRYPRCWPWVYNSKLKREGDEIDTCPNKNDTIINGLYLTEGITTYIDKIFELLNPGLVFEFV